MALAYFGSKHAIQKQGKQQMKMKTSHLALFYLVISMFIYAWLSPMCFAVDAAYTGGVIKQAEEDLALAFKSAATAEAAGANIDALVFKIVSAADILSYAQGNFTEGNYESALQLAKTCSQLVDGLVEEASNLRIDAEKAKNDRFLVMGAVSVVGLLLFLFIAFLGWSFIKRRYMRRLLKMKPEVEEHL
jgi:hypothetical protein